MGRSFYPSHHFTGMQNYLHRTFILQFVDSGITCMVKIYSNFWKWTFLLTDNNFQMEGLSEKLWQQQLKYKNGQQLRYHIELFMQISF